MPKRAQSFLILAVFPLMMVFISSLFLGPGPAAGKTEGEIITITGELRRMAVALSTQEGTGWAVILDQPLDISGETLNFIWIDPDGCKDLSAYQGERVEVTGILEHRHGQRFDYWVVVVKALRKIERPAPRQTALLEAFSHPNPLLKEGSGLKKGIGAE